MKFESTSFSSGTSPAQPQQPSLRTFTVGAGEEASTQQPFQSSPQAASSNVTTGSSFGPPPNAVPVDVEAKMRAAREAKAQEIKHGPRVGLDAKRRIELLGDIGRLTREVKIGSNTFTLRTLKARETREASLGTFATAATNLEASYDARQHILARSISQIDGHDLDEVIGSTSVADRLYWIEETLEEIVVEKLHQEFKLLKKEAEQLCGITAAEEVVADIKKP